eukprot:g3060.t1
MGNTPGSGSRGKAVPSFLEGMKWVDAQELQRQDPRSYFAPKEVDLSQLKRGDHVKLISCNMSERYWAEVVRPPNAGFVDVNIKGHLSAFDNLTRNKISHEVEISVPLSSVCDIQKRMRRQSIHAIQKSKAHSAALNIVRETNMAKSVSLEDAMSGELGSSAVYRTAEMLFKQGKINNDQFNNLIENPDAYTDAVTAMKEVVAAYERKCASETITSAENSKTKKKKKKTKKKKKGKDTRPALSSSAGNDSSKVGTKQSGRDRTDSPTASFSLESTIRELKYEHENTERYKRLVLGHVIDMFIRFEKRKPTNIELADLMVEVNDTVVYDESLASQGVDDDEFTDLIQKLSAPIESHDRVEQCLHNWLVEETRDLQLSFRTQAHFRDLQLMEEREAMEMIADDMSDADPEDGGQRSETPSSGAPKMSRQDSPLKLKRERTSSEQIVLLV